MKIALIIPTINRADLLEKQFDRDYIDFYSQCFYTHIIDNGDQGIIPPGSVQVTKTSVNLGVAGSWNLGINIAKAKGATHVILLNDDIELGFSLKHLIDSTKDIDLETTLVTSEKNWSFIFSSINLFEEVGPFDEKFYPAYFEDDDYRNRLQMFGFKHVALSKLNPKVYRNSQTIKKAPELNSNFLKNKERFHKKYQNGASPYVVETFMYNGEVDLLKKRLLFSDRFVDKWFITEWDYTFQAKEKGLSFYSDIMSADIPKELLQKIVLLVPPDKPLQNDAWTNEYYCRNFASTQLKHLSDNTLIIVSDLDEIPDYATVFRKMFSHLHKKDKIYSLEMWDQYYNLNWAFAKKTRAAKILYKPLLNQFTLQQIRSYPPANTFFDAGWHLSYFMEPEQIRDKLKSFAHTEFNKEPYTDLSYIQDRISKGEDLFKRPKNQYDLRPTSEFNNYKKPPFYGTN
jgi:beta-1,4-mannosyl-glycoprotein beta-1,4-N-acetylglucosaminyltransferase